MDQLGSGPRALALPPIIVHGTVRHPRARLRAGILLLLCWVAWGAVLTASFDFSAEYFFLVIMLVCVFLIWTNLGMLLALRTRDLRGGLGALPLEDMVRHFGLDSALIGAMQKEKKVIVFHAASGAISDVSCACPHVGLYLVV